MKTLVCKKMRTLVTIAILLLVMGSFYQILGCGGSSSDDDEGGGGGGGSSTTTVTITPSSTSTNVSGSATVKAVFSAAVTEPLSWFNLIKLQKDGSGDTLCSGISYDSTNKTLTCGHDTLDENASYTVTVAGVQDSSSTCIDDTTETFTTSGATLVSSVTKTSITSTSGGSVDITFNFSSALSASLTPTVAVSSDDDTSVTAGDCTMSGDRTSCTSTISSVEGCDTPTDYYLILSMTGYEDYDTFFNSSDNEFETATTVSSNSCWIKDCESDDDCLTSGDYTWEATGGNLVLTVENLTESRDIYYDLIHAESKSGAFTVYVSSLATLGTTGAVLDMILVQATDSAFTGLNGIMAGYNGVASYTGWLSVYQNDPGDFIFGIPDTDSSDDFVGKSTMTEDFYVCQTAYSNALTTYLSTDGENYIKLNETNMQCADGSSSCDLDEIDSRSISTWDDARLSIQLGSTNNDGNGFSANFGFARFKTSNLNGTMADCPRMTR